MKKLTYKNAGVDIAKADGFVKAINCFLSKDKLSKVSAFGCPFDLSPYFKKYNKPVLVSSTDGVGTKLKIAQMMNSHSAVGIDLVGMNVNDVICLGARPLFFLDYVACGKVKPKVLQEVLRGIHVGLEEADCALIGGETAEMPDMYKADEYDLAGFCVGIINKDEMINGSRIHRGDVIIGLESNGLHSNGFSLARKALGQALMRRYAKELLKPTRIYVKPILNLLSAQELGSLRAIKGIAHITGGAFYKKATKILPSGLGMLIKEKSWPIADIFNIIAQKGRIDKREMYSVFNMGVGMMLVTQRQYAQAVIKRLSIAKCKSWVIGEIVKSNTKMRIVA
ncbi:MAG: phosphoribosylformylglycinamidine cyclo-ligase [Candidatus Omnitrophica bacterium]|nr:phosphoribosylformylglycinamidine cyclo-ligase [Candidatus Omnitrophota bacterium]